MTNYRLFLGVVGMGIVFCAPVIYAADAYIQINGNLLSNTCAVSTDSQTKTVNMGSWATRQFSAVSRELLPVRFSINLESCGEAVSSVSTTFSGIADTDDPTLLALNTESTASHLGIAILDKDRNRIPLGNASEQYPLTAGVSDAQLVFYGQYVATQDSVTAGSANGDATFTLNYQ